MALGNRVKIAREASGVTQSELAEAISVTQAAIHALESRDSTSSRKSSEIARYLGVSIEWLLTGQGEMRSEDLTQGDNIHSPVPVSHMVPLVSWVKAGDLCETEDPFQPGDADEWLPAPCKCGPRSFYLTVTGDSMAPKYTDGMRILVDPDIEPAHGKDVVVRTPDGKSTFKRLQITPDGTFLLALNPDYPNRMVEVPADTRICGAVIAALMMV